MKAFRGSPGISDESKTWVGLVLSVPAEDVVLVDTWTKEHWHESVFDILSRKVSGYIASQAYFVKTTEAKNDPCNIQPTV